MSLILSCPKLRTAVEGWGLIAPRSYCSQVSSTTHQLATTLFRTWILSRVGTVMDREVYVYSQSAGKGLTNNNIMIIAAPCNEVHNVVSVAANPIGLLSDSQE